MRITRIALAFLLTVGFVSTASATDFAHDGVVDVYAALAVAETTELDFGIVQDLDGTVTLDVNDAITSDTNSIHVGGTIVSGVYTVTGQINQSVAVSFTGSTASGLTIGTFSHDQGDINNVALGVGGSAAITIGADLTVNAAAASTGNDQLLAFTVSVTYN